MKRCFGKIMRGGLALLCSCLLATCSFDHGIDPQLGIPTISGTVTFKGQPPENTEWVVVVASRDFPPSDVVELSLSQSQKLDLSSGSAPYRIEVPGLGRYAAVAAVWKGVGEPIVWSDILGIYGAALSGGIPFPDTVDVAPGAPVVKGVDFNADFAAVNRGAVIRGRIEYSGTWPDNTELMGIAAYAEQPQNLLEFFNVAALNISLPPKVDYFDYRLAVAPGTYQYIVVLWKARGTSAFAFVELGSHETAPGSGIPAAVTAAKGDTVRGVDIFVDLGKAR